MLYRFDLKLAADADFPELTHYPSVEKRGTSVAHGAGRVESHCHYLIYWRFGFFGVRTRRYAFGVSGAPHKAITLFL
jgi:hypothetical protein